MTKKAPTTKEALENVLHKAEQAPIKPAPTDWDATFNKILKGKTIKGVRRMTAKEIDDLGWYEGAWVIEFTDGSDMYAMSDEEGNNAGALSVLIQGENGGEHTLFPHN